MNESIFFEQVIGNRLKKIRGDPDKVPDTTIVIPVNAQNDLQTVLYVVNDLSHYSGPHTFELILVINNYLPKYTPAMIKHYCELGIRVLAIPNARREGEAPGFTARFRGVRIAPTDSVLLFDADCRILHPTELIDWYIQQFGTGADVAYTHVKYYQVIHHPSLMLQLVVHHVSRWFKRRILGIPTTRGSNYAVRKSVVIPYYDAGYMADEMNVGATIKKMGGKIAYSGKSNLVVYTSGRRFIPGWRKQYRYLRYRLLYNLRVLPTRKDVSKYTGR